MGQRTNLLLQIEGRSGARLNRVYHLQWGYRKKLPMAFLHLLSSRYFRPEDKDIFAFFPKVLNLNGLDLIDCRDWSKYDFNKLEDCQEALGHCDNNNGAMVVIVKEHKNEYTYPNFNVGFLLGPEDVDGESAFSRWVGTEEQIQQAIRLITWKHFEDIHTIASARKREKIVFYPCDDLHYPEDDEHNRCLIRHPFEGKVKYWLMQDCPYGWNVLERLGAEFCILPQWPEY